MARVLIESYVRGCKPCLLLQYHAVLGSEECFVDYPIVGGSGEKVQRYISRISGKKVEDVPRFLGGMEKEDAEKMLKVFRKRLSKTLRKIEDFPERRKEDTMPARLERSILNGGHSDARFYLCDVGLNGTVEKNYGNSRKFEFQPEQEGSALPESVYESPQLRLFALG